MKYKLLFLLFIAMSFVSCENTNVAKLEKKIAELEKSNQKLSKELNQIEFDKMKNLQLHLFPSRYNFEVGKNYTVNGKLFEISKVHKYNVYETDSLYSKESRKLLLKNITESSFEINFKPSSKFDNKMYLVAEFKLDSLKMEFPGIVNFNIN